MNIQESITLKLNKTFSPLLLEVSDESAAHRGHSGVEGMSGETHFSIKIVSSNFSGVAKLQRHRLINAALAEEIKNIHAISIHALAPGE